MDDNILSVKYTHYRVPDFSHPSGKHAPDDRILMPYSRVKHEFTPHTKGGKTVAVVTFKDGAVLVGYALCSMQDNFNYKRGREIALGRALKGMCK